MIFFSSPIYARSAVCVAVCLLMAAAQAQTPAPEANEPAQASAAPQLPLTPEQKRAERIKRLEVGENQRAALRFENEQARTPMPPDVLFQGLILSRGATAKTTAALTEAAVKKGISADTKLPPHVDLQMHTVLNARQLQDDLADLKGRVLTSSLLLELHESTKRAFERAGRPFVLVSTPEQIPGSGLVVLNATPSTLSGIKIEGAKQFSEASYRSVISTPIGSEIDLDLMEREVAFLSKNPSRAGQLEWVAGDKPNTTALVVKATEDKLWTLGSSYNNSGSPSTGIARVGFNAGYNNLWGVGHMVTYGLNGDSTFKRVLSHSLGYTAPLPWLHVLSVNYNNSTTNPDLPAPVSSNGKSSGVSVRYSMDLPMLGKGTPQAYSHSLQLGLDQKRSDNTTLFSSTPVTNSLYELWQLNALYAGNWADSLGQTNASALLTFSPGNRGRLNTDAVLSAVRADASARYTYWQLAVTRSTPLPFISQGIGWSSSLRVQGTNQNLIGSEQLGLSGSQGVRGYNVSAAFADQGFLWRNEVSKPLVQKDSMRVTGSVFVDHARGRSSKPLAEEVSPYLLGWGFGLRLVAGKVQGQIEIAKPLRALVTQADLKSKMYLSLGVSF